MVPISTSTTASIVRMPKRCRPSSSSTSRPVMMTAQNSGMWNSRFSATALPSTSARSQAATASSLSSQLGQRVQLGYQSRQHCARSLPVTTPEPRGDHLHEDRHEAGQSDDPQQVVLELCARLQIGAPVAGIHVADADQNGRADEGAPLFARSRPRGAAPRPCCARPRAKDGRPPRSLQRALRFPLQGCFDPFWC